MQSLHNYSSLVWPFGIEIRITAAQGLLTKPLTHTSFEKKIKIKIKTTKMVCFSPSICAGLFLVLLYSLVHYGLFQGRCSIAKLQNFLITVFSVAVPFPIHCHPHWRNTAMGCNCDSSQNTSFWPSIQVAFVQKKMKVSGQFHLDELSMELLY